LRWRDDWRNGAGAEYAAVRHCAPVLPGAAAVVVHRYARRHAGAAVVASLRGESSARSPGQQADEGEYGKHETKPIRHRQSFRAMRRSYHERWHCSTRFNLKCKSWRGL
jgi:hypothetical protein